jgi:hypothetical protein
MHWNKVEESLPPMEVPVCLVSDHLCFIGGRCLSANQTHWVWGKAYDPYPDGNGWAATAFVLEDLPNPTHWAYLPKV